MEEYSQMMETLRIAFWFSDKMLCYEEISLEMRNILNTFFEKKMNSS